MIAMAEASEARVRLEKAIKKKEKNDEYDRAYLAACEKIFEEHEAERLLWEAYYQDPTFPPTPVKELAGWASGQRNG